MCFSCAKHTGIEHIQLPADSPMHEADRYAVIVETYVALKDRPGAQGISVAHARKKEIYPIIGTQFVLLQGESELWVHLSEGWIKQTAVEVYPTHEKAFTAASRLK